jgi:hypothetical protein
LEGLTTGLAAFFAGADFGLFLLAAMTLKVRMRMSESRQIPAHE